MLRSFGGASTAAKNQLLAKRLPLAARLLLVALAALQAWAQRHVMNPDGISYLDMARAAAAGNWAETINGYWSPVYPWLLALAMRVSEHSRYWDFTIAHAVNLGIFLVAFAGFEFFSRECKRYPRIAPLPSWLNMLLAYGAFGWATLVWIGLQKVTPDLAVAAVVFFASGLVIRITSDRAGILDHVALGVTLGVGYLTKGAMLPLALAFIVPVAINARRKVVTPAIVTAAFCAVALPFVIVLSQKMGHPTTGDVAKLNYAWYASDVKIFKHWNGQPAGTGEPAHATRRIVGDPPTYEFATPIGGTYPVWYDPSYWHEGLHVRVRPIKQLSRIFAELQQLSWAFADLFVAGLAILVLLLRRQIGIERRMNLVLGAPLALALLLYSIVHVEPRFLGGFVAVVLAAASLILLPRSGGSSEAIIAVLAAVAILVGLRIAQTANDDAHTLLQQAKRGAETHHAWVIAQEVRAAGIPEGETIAYIGDSFRAYWAYLDGYKIGGEVAARRFWSSKPAMRKEALDSLAARGFTSVLADARLGCIESEGWTHIPGTELCVFEASHDSAT